MSIKTEYFGPNPTSKDYELEDYEYDRANRPVSLLDVLRENWVATETPTEEKNTQVVKSRIRVLLSRPLTWAEKEDLETDWSDPHLRRAGKVSDNSVKMWVDNDFEHVWAEAYLGSRVLYSIVALRLELDYVNVFPRAVLTKREYNGE